MSVTGPCGLGALALPSVRHLSVRFDSAVVSHAPSDMRSFSVKACLAVCWAHAAERCGRMPNDATLALTSSATLRTVLNR